MVSVERFLLPTFQPPASAGYSDEVPTIKGTGTLNEQSFGPPPLCFFDPPTPYRNEYNGGPSLAVLNFPEKNFGVLWEFVIVFN